MKKLLKWLFGTRTEQCNIHDVSIAFCGLPKDDTCDIEFSNKCWCCKFYVNPKQKEY